MRQMNYGSLYGGSIKPRDKEEEKKRIFLDNNFPIATVDNPYDPAKQREQILLKQIGYGINDTYTPPATTQAATPNTQDPMEELRRRLNIPEPEPFVNPITNPHQSQILQKWGEMTTPLAATIADVVTSVGSGYAQGFEKAIDAGASLASWYARLAGMDNAERKLNEFIAKDLIGDGSRMADYFEQRGSVLGDKARSVLSTGGSFLNQSQALNPGLALIVQPTYVETREALEEEQPEYMRRWKQMISPLTSTTDDIKAQLGVGAAKSVEGILDAGATAAAWGARIFGADRAEKAITNWIADDHIGDGSEYADYYTKKGSILGDGAGGEIVRGISQGVGQMLPSVAVSLIPGVGQAGALATLGLSAGGGGVEEALSEGAGLGKATLYGAAVAGTELATEKLVGGPMAKVFGGGWLDDVTGSVLKTGWGRVAKEAVGEGAEEMASEGLSPLLKSIYKGVDAFSEYGEKEYWKGVGKAGLIGTGTSVAFGGTVGRAMGTSGKAADVASLTDDISSNAKRRMELYREGKITEGDENDRRTSRTMLADYQKLQEILQKTDATERSRLIKANNLGGVVDENGTVRPSVLASLTIEDADSQTPTGEQNAAQSKKTPLSGAYLSPGLWRQSEKVQSDLAGISDDLKANGKEGKPVELFRGELSEAAQESYNSFKRAAAKLSVMSGDKLQFALVDAPSGVSGVHRGGTVYLNTETLEDGKWARVLFEEATHFTDGTAEAADFKAFLEKEDGLFEDVAEGLLAQGNAYGFTDENVMGEKSETFNREMYAQMASRVLTSPEYVDKLVRADRTLAEKIKNRISDVAETLRSVTSKDIEIRKQLRQATKAQGLFERALEATGENDGKISYDIVALEDGKTYVKANRKIITGSTLQEQRKEISDFFDNLLDENGSLDIRTIDGDVLTLTKAQTGDKARDNYKSVDGKRYEMTEKEFSVKLNIESHIDEIAETSRKLNRKPDEKNHSFAKDGFTYRKAYFEDFDGQYYEVTLSIGNDGEKATVYNVGKIEEGIPPSANVLAVVGSKPLGGTPSNSSIPQNPKMSTPKSDFSLENVSEEAGRSANVENQRASDATKERKGVTTVEDVARDLSQYVDMKRGTRNELLRKLSDLYGDMENGRITAEELEERLWDVAGYMMENRKGPTLGVDENQDDTSAIEAHNAQSERIAATLPKKIADSFWKVEKKISPEYRKMLSTIAERDDARAEVKQKDRQIAQERREAQRELQAAEANAARERDQVEQEMTRRTNDIERLGKAVKSLNTKAKDNKTRLFSPAIYRSDILKKVFADLGGISASNVNSGTVRNRIADLYEWYSDEENNIFPEIMEKNPDTERVLMNISKGKGELTREEIKALTNVVTYFGTVADHLQTCVKDGERTDAMPLAEQFVKVAKESDEKTAAAIRSAKRMFGKNKQLNYWEQFGRPETVGKIADNFSDGFFTYIMNEAQIAEVKRDKLRIDLARDVEQYLSNDKKYLGRLEKGEITFRGESMTVAEAVQLYLLLGRDQAKVHLFLGGFELQHDDKRIKCAPLRQMEDEDVRGMKPEEIIDAAEDACKIARAELSALMTESDLEFAEMLRQKYNGAMKQAKIKGDIQKQGYSNVEAGEDYTPMRIAQKVETADLSYQALEKVDRYAFNKQVYQLANNALLIQPAHKVFATHAEELATYVEIRPVVESFNIMYNLDVNNNRRNPETIKSTVERKGGFTRRAAQYTKDLLKDLQGDRFKDTRASFINDIVGKLRETFALSTLALNVNSWGSQLSSYIAAGSELRMSDLMRAGIGLYGRAKTADNVINKYSTVAMIRSYEGYATKARTLIDKTTGLSNKLMGVTSALDRFVVRRLWKVCLLQTCGSISAAKNATAEQMQKAGELLDHVILKTQQNAMVTTRSAAMRSNNELAKGVTAFSADGMMQSAQGLESTLEVEALKNQKKEALKQAKTAEETKRILEEYNPKIKAAKKKAGMAIGSMMMSSVYLAAISMAWQYIRGKLDDEEKIGMNFLWTAIGNLFGGLPIVRDLYDIFAEGYEAEFFAYTAFNDLAKNTSTMVEMTFDILSGKEVTSQEIARNLRSTVFAAGTLFGLPFRNVSNMARAALGLIGIADESIPYKFDNVFYEQSYNKDLEKALLDGDDQMVDTIVGIMLDQDGGEMNEGTRRATAKLIKSGYEGILPRSIPETLTNAQDVEVELTKKQRQQFEKVYSAAYRAADDLVRMGYFKAASKDEQAYALKFIWSTYYALAKDTVLGEDSTKKNVLFAEAIPVERLALIVAQASAIKADVDKNGKAINGSRMHKIEALIESLHLSAAQKYMMMGYLGYTNKKGRELVERYIRTLGLSQAEQAELLEMSGYREK